MSFTFAPAVREQVSLLIALAGASGSGKTKSALRLAEGISPSGKIAFIDTEARRGLHYADQHRFLHADMRPPFHPDRFVEGIRAAEEAGAEVVILDSFSHEYDGEGGIVDWADRLAEGTPKPGITEPRTKKQSNDWWKDWLEKPVESPGNWKEPKKSHKKMMGALLQCRATLIFCLRADEKIEIIRGEDGRTQVRPLGWTPICEKRFMYEMTASFTLSPASPGKPQFDLPHKLQEQHRGFFPKGRFIDEECGRALAAWARGDKPAAQPSAPIPDKPTLRPDQGSTATEERALFVRAREKARAGSEALRDWWDRLNQRQRDELAAIQPELDRLADDADTRDDFPGERSIEAA
ncbi:AAA family ATPase [uncultured Methylobacterium sp.]|jgi:hypothetical protein|uniref:AAA family ATPase n=1 Tax=uncultured Methylobacterium sp. TaxID=157278 RepID=UPI00261ED870|nr:AAA family ATPase [uncultured Methylobacterium sp.]